jgi:hypothetical protein
MLGHTARNRKCATRQARKVYGVQIIRVGKGVKGLFFICSYGI